MYQKVLKRTLKKFKCAKKIFLIYNISSEKKTRKKLFAMAAQSLKPQYLCS